MSISATDVAFGNVSLNSPATQQVTLTSSGKAPLTVSAGRVKGTGFSLSGVNFPLTLKPGETTQLNISFKPAVVGTASGTVTLASNDPGAGTATITLSGIGQAVSYQVNLAWNPPASSADPVAGYNVYRATSGNSSYQLLNPSVTAAASYIDTTVQRGTSYSYYVESVDAAGVQSAPSNTYTVNVP